MAESISGEPPRCALCRGLLWNAANGADDAWYCTSVVCEGYRRPAILPGLSRVTAATLDAADKAAAHAILGSTLSDAAGADGEAAPEPARCEYQFCPWHLRDWPRCVLPEGHDGVHDPDPGPHPWVPAAEVEAARAEGYLAGRKFEHAVLGDLLRKVIDLEEDERVHYEREVAELERRTKANRECAEASRARADGLRALLARVEALT